MTQKSKINWMGCALGVVVLYFVGYAFAVGPVRTWDFLTQTETPLNNVGDFLAGLFALPAFVLLAAAVLTQRQELDEAREQFNKSQDVIDAQMKQIARQNKIALSAAKASYKVQLHDKRMIAYQRFLDCEMAFIRDGDISQETRHMIYRCSADAKFVFGAGVNEWLNTFIVKATEYRKATILLEQYERKLERQGKEQSQQPEWHGLLRDVHEIQQWFIENMTMENADAVMGPSIRLAEDIE